jgi:hypothetical protein
MDVNVVLAPEYDRWITDQEAGAFPPFKPETHEWAYVTESFRQSTFVAARCTNVRTTYPSVVRLSLSEHWIASAANTGPWEAARVIQTMRQYSEGKGILEPGQYDIFSGNIAVHAE